MVIGEPYFSVSHLPWDDLQFWYIRSTLSQRDVTVCPLRARLMAVPVQFDDLHKIRSPLGNVEGLDLSIYDNMIEVSCTCLCLLSEMLVSLYYSDDGSYVMNNGYLSIIHGASNTQSMLFLILLQGGFKGNGVSPIKINRKKTN